MSTRTRPSQSDARPVRVGCNTCGRRSDYRPMDQTYDLVSAHGWATCSDCGVVIDPQHPDDGAVQPFTIEQAE